MNSVDLWHLRKREAKSLKFFGGFGFKDEVRIFEKILRDLGYFSANPYNICGFSYGAQKAVRFALDSLKNDRRINRVILLSPAFFNDKDSAFKDAQIRAFAKNKALYMKAFYKNVGVCAEDRQFLREIESLDSRILEQCLRYEFKGDDLVFLRSKGVEIVVILGQNDRIIDSLKANDFFSEFGIVYLIKNANHLLNVSLP